MLKVSKEVYSPAEDSFLLEGCVLKEKLTGKKCLDLGCGSGIQSVALLRAGAKIVVAVDINENALKVTQKNAANFLKKQNKSKTKTQNIGHFQEFCALKSNLFSDILGSFDFIAFNPPYVPSEEVKWVDLDGGEKGRVVIDKFLKNVRPHLKEGGVLLLLVSSLNNPKEIIEVLEKDNFSVKIVGKKKLFFEELIVLRALKRKINNLVSGF